MKKYYLILAVIFILSGFFVANTAKAVQVLIHEAYDEQVLVSEAYDEIINHPAETHVVDHPAVTHTADKNQYNEVLVTAAYDETIIDTAAWIETIHHDAVYKTVVDVAAHCSVGGTSIPTELQCGYAHGIWIPATYKQVLVTAAYNEFIDHPAITHTVPHDAVYKCDWVGFGNGKYIDPGCKYVCPLQTIVDNPAWSETIVDKEAWTETIHHEAVYKTVHHDAVYEEETESTTTTTTTTTETPTTTTTTTVPPTTTTTTTVPPTTTTTTTPPPGPTGAHIGGQYVRPAGIVLGAVTEKPTIEELRGQLKLLLEQLVSLLRQLIQILQTRTI